MLPLKISNLPSVSDNYVFRPLLRVPKILFYVRMHLYIFSDKRKEKIINKIKQFSKTKKMYNANELYLRMIYQNAQFKKFHLSVFSLVSTQIRIMRHLSFHASNNNFLPKICFVCKLSNIFKSPSKHSNIDYS
jgi:hypothetical protein